MNRSSIRATRSCTPPKVYLLNLGSIHRLFVPGLTGLRAEAEVRCLWFTQSIEGKEATHLWTRKEDRPRRDSSRARS